MTFFTDLKIKHIDNRYIFYPTLLVAVLSGAGYYFLGAGLTAAILLPVIVLILLAMLFHTYRGVVQEIKYQDSRNQAMLNIHTMVDADLPLPYLTGWAAFPELISAILKEVKLAKPDHIVEIGSGSSTIITSYLLKEHGKGRITSLDHDEYYGGLTVKELEQRGLQDLAAVHYTPLKAQEFINRTFSWYDLSSVDFEALPAIDLLVVDGPPEQTNTHARYPALPLLYPFLSEKAVVILDDAGRKEESEIVEMWLKDYPEFTHEFIPTEKGISILRRS